MKISKEFKVEDLQKRFEGEYPLLKMRLYKVHHEHHEGSRKKDEVDAQTRLTTLNPSINDGMIELNDSMTVEELETRMEVEYGLHIQIFRKSGDIWLQTSSTDSWTLRKHSEKAKESEAYAQKS